MLLYIDPSTDNIVNMKFGNPAEPKSVTEQSLDMPKSEDILQAIVKLIGKQEIKQIAIVNSAESFTLVRTIVTICNTLGLDKEIQLHELSEPVKAFSKLESFLNEPADYIIPKYSKPPNIS